MRGHFEVDPGATTGAGFAGGTTLSAPDGRAWVLVDDEPLRGLGRALAWSSRRPGITDLHVLTEHHGGQLARRASLFAVPPTVWSITGRELGRAVPEPLPPPESPDPRALALAPVLDAAGATVVVENGRVAGEVLGLEIAKVVVDANGARIEVGVGRHDREAFAMLHGDLPAPVALSRVVATVRAERRTGGAEHPLRRLAPERWLRELVIAEPGAVGARRLARAAGTVARGGVREPAPAFAVGVDGDGGPVVVACSVGIDLDLVPAAGDVRLAQAPDARLVLVLAERDAHPVTAALAAALARPADVAVVVGDWRDRLSIP